MSMSVALTSYMLSLAVFLPASGRVADRFGARRVFCMAIIIFTIGSALCGQAGSLGMLVAARLLQGLGGAMMVPVGRLLLLRSVPKQEMVSAMAWFLVPALIGPVLGPPVGGFIVTHFSWPWIFYINLPIGAVGLALVLRFIEDAQEPMPAPFDWLGLAISGMSLSCLIFGLEMVGRGALSGVAAVAVLAVGLASGALYLRHAKRHDNAILDITLMRVQSFRISVLGGSFTRIAGGSLPFLLPLMMQLGFGKSAEESGLITFASAAGAMVMKATAQPILRRLGFRRTLMWNGILACCCIASIATFRPEWPVAVIYGVLLASGFFQSLQFTAYNTLAYADLPSVRMSNAIGLYTTLQQMMLSVGICVAAIILNVATGLRGESLATLGDFSLAFLIVSAISLIASPICARLPADAGDNIAGRTSSNVQHSGMR
jgi:EmrB/QacA subfamily drug resistance transporter